MVGQGGGRSLGTWLGCDCICEVQALLNIAMSKQNECLKRIAQIEERKTKREKKVQSRPRTRQKENHPLFLLGANLRAWSRFVTGLVNDEEFY